MKDKPSEWIAISDLMAGVMAVVMLLLVLAVLQKGTSEAKYQEELKKISKLSQDPLEGISFSINDILHEKRFENLISIDIQNHRLILKDGVFERGSACLTDEAIHAMETIKVELAEFLSKNQRAGIMIEGYTDNLPVKSPVIDYQRFCTVYDDNFTLSAARAREARKAIIGSMNEEIARRIIVAGYGDSKPLTGIAASDPRNRRVEVQLLIN